MNFILPSHFAEAMDSLRAIFKVKGDTKVSLLAQERVSRAKKMMTPFVLRRRKDQVGNTLDVLTIKALTGLIPGGQRPSEEDGAHRMVRYDGPSEIHLQRRTPEVTENHIRCRIGNRNPN